MSYKKLKIYTDGGARNNPGPAGIGAVIIDSSADTDGGEIVAQISEYIGEATNNQAEYKAVIFAMEKAQSLKAEYLEIYLDSELVVKQLNREYKVKDKDLAPLFLCVHNLSLFFKKVIYKHIPREKNQEADKLVNMAIDRALTNTD